MAETGNGAEDGRASQTVRTFRGERGRSELLTRLKLAVGYAAGESWEVVQIGRTRDQACSLNCPTGEML